MLASKCWRDLEFLLVKVATVWLFLSSDVAVCQTSGGYNYPVGCSGSSCNYTASWSLDPTTDVISFSVSATLQSTYWIAIGIANVTQMMQQDVVYGFFNSSGGAVVTDAWVDARFSAPQPDVKQNILSFSLAQANGVTTMNFTRLRNTGDVQDWAFTDTNCYYFKYPYSGGTHTDTGIQKHISTPIISANQICIRSVSNVTTSTQMTTSAGTTSFTTSRMSASGTAVSTSTLLLLGSIFVMVKF